MERTAFGLVCLALLSLHSRGALAGSSLTSSGTLYGMRYCEILLGNCTDYHDDGSCSNATTLMFASHGLHDCVSFVSLSASDVAAAWSAAGGGGAATLVMVNGVRHFVVDELGASGGQSFASVATFNTARAMQKAANRGSLLTVQGAEFFGTGMVQRLSIKRGLFTESSTGAALELPQDSSADVLTAIPIVNHVGTHCKTFHAGRGVFVLKRVDGTFAMQSLFDLEGVTSGASAVGFEQIPPLSGGARAAYPALTPDGFGVTQVTVPQDERLSMCSDQVGDIFLITDPYKHSWMKIQSPPGWLQQAIAPRSAGGLERLATVAVCWALAAMHGM